MEVFLGISAVEGTGIGSAFLIPDTVKRVIPQNQITKNDILTHKLLQNCEFYKRKLKNLFKKLNKYLILINFNYFIPASFKTVLNASYSLYPV